jgi:formate/nitrite transporter FocA (FNT family)
MAASAEDVSSKIIGMYLPIIAFVVTGLEHSIANIYFIHTGIFYGAPVGYGCDKE